MGVVWGTAADDNVTVRKSALHNLKRLLTGAAQGRTGMGGPGGDI